MVKRIKRIIRKIKGLKRQEQKHLDKLKTEIPKKDTTPLYWEKEILQFKRQKRILEEKLKKLKKYKEF